MTYFAIISEGRKYAELLITRVDGRQVSSKRTGVVYATWKAAQAGLVAKNITGNAR